MGWSWSARTVIAAFVIISATLIVEKSLLRTVLRGENLFFKVIL